jgi:hypothetical protein
VSEPTVLDNAIDNLVLELGNQTGYDDESTALCANVKTLCEANAALKAANKPNTVSADTIVTVAGSLAGILAVLSYEHVNVVTSKAMSFIIKPKI